MKVRIGVSAGAQAFESAAEFWRWVMLCEGGGIDSLWCSDRLLSTTPTLEPMTTLAAIAGATKRLQFGTNAVVLPFRDPFVLAKECANIDWLSGGRLLTVFGVGNELDPLWAASGRDKRTRGRMADEMLAVMTQLFERDDVSFEGAHFKYENVSIAPKPVRRPLPLWIGGNSEAAIRRTARYGTGWLGGFTPLDLCAGVVARIKAEAERIGRPIDPDHFGVTFAFRFGDANDPPVTRFLSGLRARNYRAPESAVAIGGAEDILALIDRYVALGVTKFVALPLADGPGDLMAQTARLAEQVIPQGHARGDAPTPVR